MYKYFFSKNFHKLVRLLTALLFQKSYIYSYHQFHFVVKQTNFVWLARTCFNRFMTCLFSVFFFKFQMVREVNSTIRRGTIHIAKYLKQHQNVSSSYQYELIICTYALALTKTPLSDALLEKIEILANTTSKHWIETCKKFNGIIKKISFNTYDCRTFNMN